jgi:hypothetical protein
MRTRQTPAATARTVAGIEDLREKREGILKQISAEEAEKVDIQGKLQELTRRLTGINESLARKVGGGCGQGPGQSRALHTQRGPASATASHFCS